EWLYLPRQGILFDIEHNSFWLEEWGPRNASNGIVWVFRLRLGFVMTCEIFLLQLQLGRARLAQLNEPFLATMDVVTHPGGGTAHEDQVTTLTPSRPLVHRLPTRVSHTGFVEASPPATAQQTARVALEHPAADSRAAVDDLVLWRFPARAARDRQSLLRGVAAQAAAPGADGAGLSKGPGSIADACLAGGGVRHPYGPGDTAGLPVVRPRLHCHRLRRFARRMSAHHGVGAAFGASQQRPGGTVCVGHRPGAPASGRALGLAYRQRDGQRTVALVADVASAAARDVAGRRRRLLQLP